MTAPMIAMWRLAETRALIQPPFFLSFPADSIKTSSNIEWASGSELMPTWSFCAGAYPSRRARASAFTESFAVRRGALTTPFTPNLPRVDHAFGLCVYHPRQQG